MIEVKNITKCFGDFVAIDGISFNVENGSIYGLIGYNGAGKTTLLKTISGVYQSDGGEVLLDGEIAFENEVAKQSLFYVPDDIFFKPYATMKKMAEFYNGFYPRFNYSTFEKLASVFNLDINARLNSFSKGMQRQAEIVLGISTTPLFLMFDETFDGLDPAKRALVKELLREYIKNNDASVIVSSHDLHELEGICDRFGMIDGKHLILDMEVSEMSKGRVKVRVVFNREITEQELKDVGIDVKSFYPDGKIIIFTAEGTKEKTEEKLKPLNPILTEFMKHELDDIFMDTATGVKYDFSQIL